MRRIAALFMTSAMFASACQSATPSSTPGPVATTAPGATTPPVTAAPAVTPPAISRDPDTLVIAVDAFGADFDPASSYLLAQGLLWRGTYDGLVRLKGSSATEIEGALAATWETNADNSVWTFHLRPNVKFTDGTPVDAQAIKTNYVRLIKLALGTQLILGAFLTDPVSRSSS